MLALVLATVLALPPMPAAVQAWAEEACPPPARGAHRELAEARRAVCLREAMDQALEALLLPLEVRAPPTADVWRALQADYERWAHEACAAVEEALDSGEGLTGSRCLQHQYAWRGFFLDAWAREDWKALQQALSGYLEPAGRARKSLPRYRALLEDGPSALARLERLLFLPEVLARRQCALAPGPAADCPRRFAHSLYAFLDFSAALSDAP